MITLDDVQREWEEDGKIDRTEPGKESLRVPILHGKYYKLLLQAKKQHLQAKQMAAKLLRLKTEYFTGTLSEEDLKKRGWKPNPLFISKSDVKMYLEADDEYQKIESYYNDTKELVDYITDIMKCINQRNFQIRNHIEWERFMTGVA